jgi:hypothetical protein
VANKASLASCSNLPSLIKKCDIVIVAPEVNKIIVFNNGISKGLKIKFCKSFGGQVKFNSILGAKPNQKKAQKKPKKNITSEKINKSIL